ncbi:hypothetical protein ACTFIU_007757 [Dictyostelium citrinum]
MTQMLEIINLYPWLNNIITSGSNNSKDNNNMENNFNNTNNNNNSNNINNNNNNNGGSKRYDLMSLSNLTNDDEPTRQPTFYCSRVVVAVVVLKNPASQVQSCKRTRGVSINSLANFLCKITTSYCSDMIDFETVSSNNCSFNNSPLSFNNGNNGNNNNSKFKWNNFNDTNNTVKNFATYNNIPSLQSISSIKEQNPALSGFDEHGIHKSILEAAISD